MSDEAESRVELRYQEQIANFPYWEKIKDVVDQLMDIMFNYRQSGHPGGSRSKAHMLLATMLSGVSRWDIRHPEKRFGDRFVLVGGHTIPLAYATLAVFNEALRIKYAQTGDQRYLVPNAEERMLTWEDLLGFRRNGGLSGHAEMEGKTLILKFNTGPSGHGTPASAGQAMALKQAGAEGVKVFAFEGEGGLTPGGVHETRNAAWAFGLDNLHFLVDWNNYGIDDTPCSEVIPGTPATWFGSCGWRVVGTEQGSEWDTVTKTLMDLVFGPNPEKVPSAAWFKTRKGRGYGVYDNKSHGAPLPMNGEIFWRNAGAFAEKYGVKFIGFNEPAPKDPAALKEQYRANLEVAISVLKSDQELVDYLADRLVELGESVPKEIPSFRLDTSRNPWKDERIYDYENYPQEMFAKPGEKQPNRAGLAKWGAWVNAFGRENYGRPLFIACSADLAASTNINGFAQKWGDIPGWGVYCRHSNPEGSLLPTEITEFTNAGLMAGLASVNFAEDPYSEFQGFYGTTSTYGAFVYLHYGLMRLYSQMAQDCDFKLGKILWVVGHSGPETAEDSRTHFGIFSPGVTQLFPKGQVIDVHPWEHNEVPVVIGAALKQDVPIVALHLTRPPVEIPDRAALGIDSHFAAAKGAYLIRDYKPGQKRMGTVIVQGTSTTNNIVKLLPELDKAGLNVKIVAAISPDLFRLQPASYRDRILSQSDLVDSMCVTNRALRLMSDWIVVKVAEEYSMSSDWDNRWRTGGSVDEVVAEAHLSPEWILKGIERFVADREIRLRRVAEMAESALKL
ncbi:MAG: transketolase [Chloroflexota bacterium]|jgi:transketolase